MSLLGRFNGWILDVTKGGLNKVHGGRKQRLLGDLTGTVVELGAGTGANFGYYRSDLDLVVIEPNTDFHERLRRSAVEHGRDIEIRTLSGEQLDFPDASVDTIVATLVMCTVDDPAAVAAEIKRVLKPGGRFIFIDHVAAPADTMMRRVQNLVSLPHRTLFEGCRPNRETEATLISAGFELKDMERFRTPLMTGYTRSHIAGIARKPN